MSLYLHHYDVAWRHKLDTTMPVLVVVTIREAFHSSDYIKVFKAFTWPTVALSAIENNTSLELLGLNPSFQAAKRLIFVTKYNTNSIS